MNKKRVFYFLLIFLIFNLFALEIFLSNRLSEDGEKLYTLQNEIKILEENNKILESKIAASSGLTQIKIKAESMGFKINPAVLNLTHETPVALSKR